MTVDDNDDDSSSYKFSSANLKKKGKKLKLKPRQQQAVADHDGCVDDVGDKNNSSGKSAPKEKYASKLGGLRSTSISKGFKTEHGGGAVPVTPKGEKSPSSVEEKIKMFSQNQRKAMSPSTTVSPKKNVENIDTTTAPKQNVMTMLSKKSKTSPSSLSPSSRSLPKKKSPQPSSSSSPESASTKSRSSCSREQTQRKQSPQEQKYPSKIPKRDSTTTRKRTPSNNREIRRNDDEDDDDGSEYASIPLSSPPPKDDSPDRAAGGGRQVRQGLPVDCKNVGGQQIDTVMLSPSAFQRSRPWHREYTEASKAARSEKRVQRSTDSVTRSLQSSSISVDTLRSMKSALNGTDMDVVMGDLSDSDSRSGSISSRSALSSSTSSSSDSDGKRVKGVYNRYRKYLNKDGSNKDTPEEQTEHFKKSSIKLSAPPQLDFTYRYQDDSNNIVKMEHILPDGTSGGAASAALGRWQNKADADTDGKSSTKGRLSKHLQSDKLPQEDLKMIGSLFDSQSQMSYNDDSTLGSDVRSYRASERSLTKRSGRSVSSLESIDGIVIKEDTEGEMSNQSSTGGNNEGEEPLVFDEKSFHETHREFGDNVTKDNHQDKNEAHLEGLNQPKTAEDDSGSLGSDLFEAPKKAVTDRPLLAAAKKAKEQKDASYRYSNIAVVGCVVSDAKTNKERELQSAPVRAIDMTGAIRTAREEEHDDDDFEIFDDDDISQKLSYRDVVNEVEGGNRFPSHDESSEQRESSRNHSPQLSNVREEEISEDSEDSFLMWQRTVEVEQNLPPPSMDHLDDSNKSSQSMSFYSQQKHKSLNPDETEDSISVGGSWQAVRSAKNNEQAAPTSPATSSQSLDALELQNLPSKPTTYRGNRRDESSLSECDLNKSSLSVQNDDDSMEDEFSLKAESLTEDLNAHQSTSERPEYDHKLSKKNLMEHYMNAGIHDLNASFLAINDDSVEGDVERGDDALITHESRVDSSETKDFKTPNVAPALRSAASHGICRYTFHALVCLLIIAAIVLPLYFLVFGNNSSDGIDSGNGTGPILPPGTTMAPTIPTETAPSVAPPSNIPPVASPIMPPTSSVSSPSPTSSPISSPTSPPTIMPMPEVPTVQPVDGTAVPSTNTDNLASLLISRWPSLEEDLQDPNSSQSLAYAWLMNDPDVGSFDDTRILQRFSLAVFYYSTGGANWERNDRWLSEENECLWYTSSSALPCDDSLRYTTIDLDFNNLSGTIASELGLLSNSLTQLDLSGNGEGLSGSIPALLGFLTMLTSIDLSRNALQGTIPGSAGKWNKLQLLDLSMNELTGALPLSIGIWTDLRVMNLEKNRLGGSLPTTIAAMTSLQTLNLVDNAFTGAVLPELGESVTSLQDIILSNNQFTSLPDEIGNLGLLRELFVDNNKLVGTITSSIGKLVGLLSLNLAGNSISGPIPTELGRLESIRDELNLSRNSLTGQLPAELGNLRFLRNLLLNDNMLTGPVPSSFGQLVRISILRLEDNNLTGTVPDEACLVYNDTYPVFVTDCSEDGGIDCPCCMFCCDSLSGSCECQFAGTELDFLCVELSESSGLEDRMFPN